MTKRERFCWNCGASLGVISAGYDEIDLICERVECERAATKTALEDRREYEYEEWLQHEQERWRR